MGAAEGGVAVDGEQGLRDALATVRGRIDQIRGRSTAIGEQDTKASLIDPVLSALGWRLDDLDEVRREYRGQSKDNPADYALMAFGSPCLFVEAKALSVSLDRKCASQAIGYATTLGVSWCLLTNGDEYRLYNAHAAVDVDEKLFRCVKLSDPGQEADCLETLGLLKKDRMQKDTAIDALWKIQFVDRRVRVALGRLIDSDDAGLAGLVHKEVPVLTLADVRESLRRARVRIDFPSASVALPASHTPPTPVTVDVKPNAQLPGASPVTLRQLIAAQGIVPPLPLEAVHRGVGLTAAVTADGSITYSGKSYGTPSAAGGAARAEVAGNPNGPFPATNGWVFWKYRDPVSGDLVPLGNLRLAGQQ